MSFFHSNFLLQPSHDDDQRLPSSIRSPQAFQDGSSQFVKRSSMSFRGLYEEMNQSNQGEDDLSDDGSQLGEKKRRLNMEQVRTLEKNFELANKLEPERKLQLARDLGLQPRQVAIWFQNRRARWKTKQLEKDYGLLKRQFEAAKSENDALRAQNQKLHSEILALKSRETMESINLNKETEGSSSENTSENKQDTSRNPAISSSPDQVVAAGGSSLFPSPAVRRGAVPDLFHSSSRPEIHSPKIEQAVKEESSFCNMLCGVDDQTVFWPWIQQQNFS